MKRMILRGLLVLIFIVPFVFAACGNPASTVIATPTSTSATIEEYYEWNFQATLPATETDYTIGIAKFADMVSTNTNGRIKLNIFPVGGIVEQAETMNAIRDGIIEMGDISAGYGQGAIPALAVLDGLPLTWQSGTEIYELFYDFGLADLVEPAINNYGLQLLGFYGTSLSGLGMLTENQVKTLDDFKGMKVRTYGAFVNLYQKLGCSVVTLGLGDVYQAAQTGVVDGVFTNLVGHSFFNTCDVLKYGTLPVIIGGTGGMILVSPKAYRSLSPDLQKILNMTFDEWAWWLLRYYNKYEKPDTQGAIKILENRGVTFTTLSSTDQVKLTQIAEESWNDIAAKDALSAEAVGIVKEYLKKVGRLQ